MLANMYPRANRARHQCNKASQSLIVSFPSSKYVMQSITINQSQHVTAWVLNYEYVSVPAFHDVNVP
jgi:hypothetical protein